ncbi:sugar transferase [Halobacteriovorax sp. RZ-3]|uniref:sugar transferase n=1 Tax=Halobacteriovorax sp. RZ-3 TaxID=3157720 RepID=UPI003710F9F4
MKFIIKRLIDITVSVLLLIVLFPVLILTCILIALLDGLPVFFTQRRPGLDEKIFKIYKFRTMKAQNAAGTLSDFERTTKLGNFIRKSSLDEIPQLFNVLKGELSLVGPRPLLVEYLELYNSEQKKRHNVKPGITGWAQVNGRNSISWEEKFALDTWYAENWSILLDLKILFLTFVKVFKQSDINSGEQTTMHKFTGTKNHE